MTLISFLNAFDFILSFPQVFIQNMLLFLESLFFKERELVLVSLKREKKQTKTCLLMQGLSRCFYQIYPSEQFHQITLSSRYHPHNGD